MAGWFLPAVLFFLGTDLLPAADLIAYKAARIVSKAGESVSPGFLLVREGKVENVLAGDAKLPEGAEVVDLGAAVILPGMVNPLSAISKANYRSGPGRASQSNSSPTDGRKSLGYSAVNLKHEIYRRLGRTGYTTFAIVPNDTKGLIAGQASVIRPAVGKEKEARELVVTESAYLMLGFASGKAWYDAGIKHLKKAADGILKEKADKKKAEEEARKKAEEAKKKPEKPPGEKKKPPVKPPAKPAVKPAAKPAAKPKPPDPLVQLFKGEKKAFLRVRSPAAIAHLFAFLDSLPMKFQFVLVTAPQSPEVIDLLIEKKKQITAVILEPRMGRLPDTSIYVNSARLLLRAGIPVAFVPLRDTLEGHREIFFPLAAMIKSGVLPHEALAGVTSVPAELLGLGSKVGSLSKGAMANFVCYDRDPLSGTARMLSVYVEGKKVFEDDPSTGKLSGEAVR